MIVPEEGLVLNIYKPAGMSSFGVVRAVRKKLGINLQGRPDSRLSTDNIGNSDLRGSGPTIAKIKAGHCGTLDPMAEGVMIVVVGKATKLAAEMTGYDKVYETTVLLGRETDSYDIMGKVVSEKNAADFSKDELEAVLDKFRGEIEQVPPMFSALKVKGKKLYELARKGKSIERAARKVTIYELSLLKWEKPRLELRIHCSKGTYIRSLAYDIGRELGCGGCVERLIRTRAGNFRIEDALTLEDI